MCPLQVLGGFLLLISCVFTLSDCILPRPRNQASFSVGIKSSVPTSFTLTCVTRCWFFCHLESAQMDIVIQIYIPYQGHCIFIIDTLSVDINSYCLRPFPSTSSKSISALGLQTAGLLCRFGLTKPPKSWKPIPPN